MAMRLVSLTHCHTAWPRLIVNDFPGRAGTGGLSGRADGAGARSRSLRGRLRSGASGRANSGPGVAWVAHGLAYNGASARTVLGLSLSVELVTPAAPESGLEAVLFSAERTLLAWQRSTLA